MQFLFYPQDFLLLPSTLHRRPLLSLQIGRTHIIQTSRNFKEKSDFQEFITLLIQAFSVFGFAEQKCTRIMTHFPPLEKHYTCALLCKKRAKRFTRHSFTEMSWSQATTETHQTQLFFQL